MKLEVGMYVRTKKGSIAKVLGFDIFEEGKGTNIENLEAVYFNKMVNDIDKDIYRGCFNEVFKNAKASHNIIDLIKRNDIILGKDGKIYQVWKVYKDYVFTYFKNKYGQTITLVDYQIDKILTRESFENNCYKIGDE